MLYEDVGNPAKMTTSSGGRVIGKVKGSVGGNLAYEGDSLLIECFGISGSTFASSSPTVQTANTISALSPTGATASSGIIANGGDAVTALGYVIYPSGNASTVIGGAGVTNYPYTPVIQSGAFSINFTGLTTGSPYCCKPYATNPSGTTYGTETCFTPVAVLPALAGSPSIGSLTHNSATGTIGITNNGGTTITAQGMAVYLSGTTPSNIGDPGVTVFNASPITQSGSTTVPMTGLLPSTNYCSKPFSTNSVGTVYDTEVCFTTSAVPDTAPVMG